MLLSLVLPFVAFPTLVLLKVTCSLSTTISAADAIRSLNSCPTLEGDIVITGEEYSELDWSDVKSIKANVTIENSANVTSMDFSSLETIGGSLELNFLTEVELLNFTLLKSASELSLISLTSLALLNMGQDTIVSSFTLYNTKITSIDLLMDYKTIGSLVVSNNKDIVSIDLSETETVDSWLVLSFNGNDAEVKLPNLSTAANLDIQDVAELSVPSLTSISETLVLGYNTFDLVDFEVLESIGVAVQVFSNDAMHSLSFPKLTYVNGSVEITNNTVLTNIDLDKLETIAGATTIDGDFYNFTLPALTAADGLFTICSSNSNFTCDYFDNLHLGGEIKAAGYNCTEPTVTTTSSGSSSKSSGGNFLTPNFVLSVLVASVVALSV